MTSGLAANSEKCLIGPAGHISLISPAEVLDSLVALDKQSRPLRNIPTGGYALLFPPLVFIVVLKRRRHGCTFPPQLLLQ